MAKSRYQYSGRTEQHKASLKRLLDAQHLQRQARWRGAMYLAGYSIECKLKAKLMEMYQVNNLEELEARIEQRAGQKMSVTTHSIEVLFTLTGARDRLLHSTSGSVIRAYTVCNRWVPAWRYKPDDGSRDECDIFMDAVVQFGKFIEKNV